MPDSCIASCFYMTCTSERSVQVFLYCFVIPSRNTERRSSCMSSCAAFLFKGAAEETVPNVLYSANVSLLFIYLFTVAEAGETDTSQQVMLDCTCAQTEDDATKGQLHQYYVSILTLAFSSPAPTVTALQREKWTGSTRRLCNTQLSVRSTNYQHYKYTNYTSLWTDTTASDGSTKLPFHSIVFSVSLPFFASESACICVCVCLFVCQWGLNGCLQLGRTLFRPRYAS